MASFTKRGNTWSYRVSISSPDGKRHYVNKGGFKTKHAAQMEARVIESSKDKGLSVETSKQPLSDYFKTWYELYIKPGSKYNTRHHYLVTLNILKRNSIGNYPLNQITPAIYQSFINDYGADHAQWTMKKLNAQIRASIKRAVFDGKINRDFTQDVRLIFDKDKSRKTVWLNATQTQIVINDLIKSLETSQRPVSRFMVLTDLLTGLRIGELMALTWDDVDLSARTINVNKSWDYVNYKNRSPKTAASNRVIKINSVLVTQLQHLKRFQHTKNDDQPHSQIFLNNHRKISTVAALNKQVRNVLKECEIDIPEFHFHSLRHTHASFLLYKGVSIFAISQRLGHSNVQITMSVYSHVISEMKDQESDKIIGALDSLYNTDHQVK